MVCTVHVETRSAGFLVEPQNQGRWCVGGLASKPVARVSRFGPQNWQIQFGDLELKITTTVSWFVPKNQASFDMSVAPQNRWSEDGMGHASRSGGLLRLEASRVRVSQSSLKIGGGATMGSVYDTITEVASRLS
jgi:hypothetical protein